MQPARQVDSRATKAFEGVTVTEQGRFIQAVPVGSRTRSCTEESQASKLLLECVTECGNCTGIQALTTGEKALSHHLLTRAALAPQQARRFDRRRHIIAREEKISFPSNTLETRTASSWRKIADTGWRQERVTRGLARRAKETPKSASKRRRLGPWSRTRDTDMKDPAEGKRA